MLQRWSLTTKMVLLTLLVGAATWYPLDAIHTAELRRLFQTQLMQQLELKAQDDRQLFDQYIRAHQQAARFFAAHPHLSAWLDAREDEGWQHQPEPPAPSADLPAWLPRASVLRVFPLPRFALLLDPAHRVREVYQSGAEPPPQELLRPGMLIAQLSHAGALMTTVEGRPYLLALERVLADGGRERAALVLATPLDSEMLRVSQRQSGGNHLTLLVQHGRVLASSRDEVIPAGSATGDLAAEYLTTGRSFFDYGVSDLLVEFTTVMPTDQVEALSHQVLSHERYQRAITAFTLLGAFLLLTVWVSRYVRGVTLGILAFSRRTLGVEPRTPGRGDELHALRAQFEALEQEIVGSREALARAVELRTRSELEAAQQARTVALLREVTEALGVGVLRVGPGGRVAPLNRVMEEFLDCTEQFLVEEGVDRDEREVACGGRVRLFDLHRPVAEFVLVREVTGEREVRRRLKLALQVIDHSTQGMFVTDAEGSILLVNPALTRITGLNEAQVQAHGLRQLPLPAPDPEALAEAERALARQGAWEGELLTRCADGVDRYLWVRSDAVRDELGRVTHYVGILSDVTERHRAQERLSRYAEDLRQANEEVKNFAYIVSHDLRAPLVNIRGFVSELRQTLGEMQPTMQCLLPNLEGPERGQLENACRDIPEALEFIDTSVRKMDGLIQAILALSRLGRRELHPEPIDTRALVEEQIASLRFQLEERSCRVEIGDLPAVTADRTALGQIFGNLLSNAVKFLERGRAGFIEVSAQEEPGQVLFHVRDNGRGIAHEDFPKVFAIFRRAGRQDTPGEGMGMPFVQTLVRRHGGRIWFESEAGVGSVFSFCLPASPPPELMQGEQDAA